MNLLAELEAEKAGKVVGAPLEEHELTGSINRKQVFSTSQLLKPLTLKDHAMSSRQNENRTSYQVSETNFVSHRKPSVRNKSELRSSFTKPSSDLQAIIEMHREQ